MYFISMRSFTIMIRERILTGGVVLYSFLKVCSASEIMEGNSGDPVLVVDQQQEPVDETKLPNSHSAALVMAFIFLCVFGYCAYRILKRKCCIQKLSSSLSERHKDGDCAIEGLDDIIKQREDYLAIYGPKKNITSISGVVSRNEKADFVVVGASKS